MSLKQRVTGSSFFRYRVVPHIVRRQERARPLFDQRWLHDQRHAVQPVHASATRRVPRANARPEIVALQLAAEPQATLEVCGLAAVHRFGSGRPAGAFRHQYTGGPAAGPGVCPPLLSTTGGRSRWDG